MRVRRCVARLQHHCRRHHFILTAGHGLCAYPQDFDNACAAYQKAIEMESDHLFELNFAITLCNNGDYEQARGHFLEFERLFQALDSETKNSDAEVLEQRQSLSHILLVDADEDGEDGQD
jgi:tetratricopeptide (TPR) repeat protein